MELDASISAEELKVFLEETDEQIQLLDEDIVRLEKEGENPDLLQEIFRAAHTIKGSSAMVGHQRMADLTHAMESLLDRLRNGELKVSTEIIDALLYGLDALKVLKDEITSSEDSGLDTAPVIARLKDVIGEDSRPTQTSQSVLILDQDAKGRLQVALARGQSVYRVKVFINRGSEWAAVRCLQSLNELARVGDVISSAPSAKEIDEEKVGFDLEVIFASSEDKDTIQGVLISIPDIDTVEVTPYDSEGDTAADRKLTPAQQGATSQDSEAIDKSRKGLDGSAQRESAQTFQTVRIDVQILDDLMNTVGELVIDRSRISRLGKMLEAKYANDGLIQELGQTSNHIVKVINELQENIMKVRMVPIGTIFSRFPRLVRDLAQTQSKNLNFIVEGEETELDRSIIEQIRDPLIHLLRNAVDHGVEPPEQRQAAGKPKVATVRLAAYHEQGSIVITLEDDGRGIGTTKIKDSAVKRGVISSEMSENLTEAEAINLIFLAGMSTAEKATEVSGRGVGLDIVRANIESLSGSVGFDTKVGEGTKFTIRLPLTVAIIQGLLLSSGGVTYVMPLVSILETLMIEPSEIQTVSQREIIRLRDSIIPVVRLDMVIGTKIGINFAAKALEPESDDRKIVIVARTSNMTVGVIVDDVMERQEVVVKSLGSYLGDITGIAGATILGDGQVALILDVASLAKMAMRGGREESRVVIG